MGRDNILESHSILNGHAITECLRPLADSPPSCVSRKSGPLRISRSLRYGSHTQGNFELKGVKTLQTDSNNHNGSLAIRAGLRALTGPVTLELAGRRYSSVGIKLNILS